jgi:ubiquinone/menaquinone biosynthesis C-methylase UbiE
MNMNEFDQKAATWDSNPMHYERSVAIVKTMQEMIPLNSEMTALEFGAGTGITGFLLKDQLKNITMIDSSEAMVRIMNEKISSSGEKNLKAVFYDLEKKPWEGSSFDLLMTQMVLHHVNDVKSLMIKFHEMLNKGGYLAIADLYSEDGSFHGENFTGHKGFDPGELSGIIAGTGFQDINHLKCFTIQKTVENGKIREFDVFILTARKHESE